LARLSKTGKNARLGDGVLTVGKSNVNARSGFMSTDKSWLNFKLRLCEHEGIKVTSKGTQKSGYGGTKTIYKFTSRVNERLTEVYNASIDEVISDLDKVDLFIWFIDDGSWHKTSNTIHLYCNMFDDREVSLLSDQIEELYKVRPTKRIDRKKDGRQFNYLYFPRDLVRLFHPEAKEFIEANHLESMYYKVGGKYYEDKPPREQLSDDTVRTIRRLYKGKRGDIKFIVKRLEISRDKVKGVTSGQTYKSVF